MATVTDHDALEGREEVLEVLEMLQSELSTGADWENITLDRFLDALSALLGSIENAYSSIGRPIPTSSWSLMAEALRGARFYE